MRRLHRLAWLSLALLSLFTMAAGTAVAHLLPARLALWRLPTVASHRWPRPGRCSARRVTRPPVRHSPHITGRPGFPGR